MLLTVAMLIAAMVLCAGCSGGNAAGRMDMAAGDRTATIHVVVTTSPGTLSDMVNPTFGLGSAGYNWLLLDGHTRRIVPDPTDPHVGRVDLVLQTLPAQESGSQMYVPVVFEDVTPDLAWHPMYGERGQVYESDEGHGYFVFCHRDFDVKDWVWSVGFKSVDARNFTLNFPVVVYPR